MPRKRTLTPEEREENRRVYKHNYYLQHRERLLAYHKERRDSMTPEEREKQRAYNRAYYAANKEQFAQYRAERWAGMTEEQRETHRNICRAWNQANPERRRKTQKEWLEKNREQVNAKRRKKHKEKKA